jgi:hypothetical protein
MWLDRGYRPGQVSAEQRWRSCAERRRVRASGNSDRDAQADRLRCRSTRARCSRGKREAARRLGRCQHAALELPHNCLRAGRRLVAGGDTEFVAQQGSELFVDGQDSGGAVCSSEALYEVPIAGLAIWGAGDQLARSVRPRRVQYRTIELGPLALELDKRRSTARLQIQSEAALPSGWTICDDTTDLRSRSCLAEGCAAGLMGRLGIAHTGTDTCFQIGKQPPQHCD